MDRRHGDRQVRLILWGMVALYFIGAIAGTILINQNASRIHDVQVLTHAIQDQRYAACLDANMRHAGTILALDGILAHVPASERTRAKAGRESTILLINALVPVRNCATYAPRRP